MTLQLMYSCWIVAGTIGVVAGLRSCYSRSGSQESVAPTAFMASSLVAIATANLVLVLTGIGLTRDLRHLRPEQVLNCVTCFVQWLTIKAACSIDLCHPIPAYQIFLGDVTIHKWLDGFHGWLDERQRLVLWRDLYEIKLTKSVVRFVVKGYCFCEEFNFTHECPRSCKRNSGQKINVCTV